MDHETFNQTIKDAYGSNPNPNPNPNLNPDLTSR